MGEQAQAETILDIIRQQAENRQVRFTQHAHQEMSAENYMLADVIAGIASATIIENYPEHRRGACCLLNGITQSGRPIHVVCTTSHPVLIVITVYEPKPPKWPTPTQRRQA